MSDFPRDRITYPAGPTKGEPIEIGHEAEYSSLSNGPQRQRVTGTSYYQEWQSRVWLPRVHFSGFTVPLKQILGQVVEPIRFNLPIEVPYDRAQEIVEGIDKGHAFTMGGLFVDSDKETFLATLAEVWGDRAQNVRTGASSTPVDGADGASSGTDTGTSILTLARLAGMASDVLKQLRQTVPSLPPDQLVRLAEELSATLDHALAMGYTLVRPDTSGGPLERKPGFIGDFADLLATAEAAMHSTAKAAELTGRLRDLQKIGAVVVLKDSPAQNVRTGADTGFVRVRRSALFGIYEMLKEIEREINQGRNVRNMVEDVIEDVKLLLKD